MLLGHILSDEPVVIGYFGSLIDSRPRANPTRGDQPLTKKKNALIK